VLLRYSGDGTVDTFCLRFFFQVSPSTVFAQKREAHSRTGWVEYYAVNGISVVQGPNYALAQRVAKHCRTKPHCFLGIRSIYDPTVSRQQPLLLPGYEGMPYFKPALVLPKLFGHRLSCFMTQPCESSNPKNRSGQLTSFSFGAFHGGGDAPRN
jgi:hypothetical protein